MGVRICSFYSIKYIISTTRIPELLGVFLNLNKMKTKRISITCANILFTIDHRDNKCLN